MAMPKGYRSPRSPRRLETTLASLLAMCSVACGACGAAGTAARHPPAAPSRAGPPLEGAWPLFDPGSATGQIEARLVERHHAEVIALQPVGVVTRPGAARVYVVYIYSALASWLGFEEAEDELDESEEALAESESEVWRARLRASGLSEEADRRATALADACEAGQGAYHDCLANSNSDDPEDECDILAWSPTTAAGETVRDCSDRGILQQVLEELNIGCGEDRIGLALFAASLDEQGEEVESLTLEAATTLAGQRFNASPHMFPFDIDGDGEAEMLVEARWIEIMDIEIMDEGAVEVPAMVERIDLLLVDGDLSLQGSTRLTSRSIADAGRPALEDFPDGRYWFEDRDGDGRLELVIERFVVPGPCELRPICNRLALAEGEGESGGGGALGLRYFADPPCFPRAETPASAGCSRREVDQTVLSFNEERNSWM